MRGKQKCRILREIRRKIADENDIPFVTRDCRYQGDCTGTCPKCESELRYLEQELERRAALGKRITVAALCAGMSFAAVGCGGTSLISEPQPVDELSGAAPPEENTAETPGPSGTSDDSGIVELSGEVAYDYDMSDPADTSAPACTADAPAPASTGADPGMIELSGEVPYDYELPDASDTARSAAAPASPETKKEQGEDPSADPPEAVLIEDDLMGLVPY